MTKDEILDALEDGRERFLDDIAGLSENTLIEPGVIGDWSVKDILAHISAWEAELVKLLWQVSQERIPASLLVEDVSVDDLNAAWQAETHKRPLERVLGDFAGVRKQTSRRVEAFSDADFNDAGRFAWLKGEPLDDIIL